MEELPQNGRRVLEDIATGCARGHGLQIMDMIWEAIGDECFLVVRTDQHAVRIPFSSAEVEAIAEEQVARSARHKIRDKFAGLSI